MTRRLKIQDIEEPRGPGRPSIGNGAQLNIKLQPELLDAMAQYADEHQLSASEAWRRAARAFLGLENRLPEDV